MKNLYKINNSLERINRGTYTLFLDNSELKIIKGKLNKNSYKIFYPYQESDKVILYSKELPYIKLFKIENSCNLKHQDILGAIYNLGIDISYIGDIIKYRESFYIYVLEELSNYLVENLTLISNNKVKLLENELIDYKREYENITLIVSSLRIDNVISSLINLSRNNVLDIIKNKQVILNYESLTKNSYILKEDDVFSIRRYGKYKFIGIENKTKKDKLVINILKYK